MADQAEHTVCPRCRRPFECRVADIDRCQCQPIRLTNAQQYYIRSRYEGCLCANCLLALQLAYEQSTLQ